MLGWVQPLAVIIAALIGASALLYVNRKNKKSVDDQPGINSIHGVKAGKDSKVSIQQKYQGK